MNPRIREKAVDTLWRAEKDGRFVQDVLVGMYPRCPGASDRAFLTEMVNGCVRWRGTLDLVLGQYRPIKKIKTPLLWILRVALYQMGFLPRVTDRVAVDAAVEQAKSRSGVGGGRLTNALLRRIQADWHRLSIATEEADPLRDVVCPGGDIWRGPDSVFPDPENSLSKNLAARFSLPEWIVARWIRNHGEKTAETLVNVQNFRPAMHCWIDPRRGGREALQAELQEEGIETEPTPYGLRVLHGAARVTTSRSFLSGKILIQDETPSAVVPFLEVSPGDRVLEVGAAPGGKTVALARAVGSNGRVVALDRSERRLELLRKNLDRLGLQGRVELVVGDGTRLPEGFSSSFDRVLLDVPCSNTGVLARRVDVRWRLKSEDISSLSDIQRSMLAEGLRTLRPSLGRLVYSTCSIEREENQEVVASEQEWKVLEEEETLPNGYRDGGYKARLQRK